MLKKNNVIVQFNEANFNIIKKYCKKYDFTNISKFLKRSECIKTYSEKEYKYLEPWIQWYSFYTNDSYKKHRVFHLDNSTSKKKETFCSKLSIKKKIGIFCSMNIPKNSKYNIYIPDPWSTNSSDKSLSSQFVYKAIKQIVNTNSKMKISISSIIGIIIMIGFPKNMKDILF